MTSSGNFASVAVIRMSYRRQKRWWNAYILFYERIDEEDSVEDVNKAVQDLSIGEKT